MKSFGITILRIGMAIVIVWFGAQQLLNPNQWIGFLPDWTASALVAQYISQHGFVLLNGWFEVFAGTLLILGFYVNIVAFFLAIHMIAITASIGYDAIGVRDFGLAFSLLSLAFTGAGSLSLDGAFEKSAEKKAEEGGAPAAAPSAFPISSAASASKPSASAPSDVLRPLGSMSSAMSAASMPTMATMPAATNPAPVSQPIAAARPAEMTPDAVAAMAARLSGTGNAAAVAPIAPAIPVTADPAPVPTAPASITVSAVPSTPPPASPASPGGPDMLAPLG